MHIIRGLHNIKPQHQECVLTIGNFDGLHLGHQAMLKLMVKQANTQNTHSCLMTFSPLPQEYFADLAIKSAQKSATESTTEATEATKQPTSQRSRLLNQQEKIRTLMHFPADTRPDNLLIMPFNQTLASMTAEQFIEQILVAKLKVKTIIIGDDFRFGCDRKGDSELLRTSGEKYDFTVESLSSHCLADIRVSSTLIRDALKNNELALADKMLGRTYTICGHVAHGDKRGRTIGFPTANIHLRRPQTPLHGVYSVTMHTDKYGDIKGIANLGRRPTVNGERIQLEVHCFDFDNDLYGQYVCVSFSHKIRDEKKFDSFDELKQQIQLDCAVAIEHHNAINNGNPK